MWVIVPNLLGFINGYFTALAMHVLLDGGAYTDAAVVFATRIGIGAAVLAIVGRGNAMQWVGLLLGFLGVLA